MGALLHWYMCRWGPNFEILGSGRAETILWCPGWGCNPPLITFSSILDVWKVFYYLHMQWVSLWVHTHNPTLGLFSCTFWHRMSSWRHESIHNNTQIHNKHHHHGGGATNPSGGVDLMNPCPQVQAALRIPLPRSPLNGFDRFIKLM
jgi:hypothetical protein